MTNHRNDECIIPYQISMTVYAHPDADLHDVQAMIHEVAYAGGCLEPGNPRFYGLCVRNLTIIRKLPSE